MGDLGNLGGKFVRDAAVNRRTVLKTIGGAGAAALGGGLGRAAAPAAAQELSGDLTIWTFFDQVEDMAAQFNAKYPGVNAQVQIFPGDQYETKVRLALQSGQDAPDVFDMERGYLGRFLNSPFAEDLSAMGGDELVTDYVPYVAALGRDANGVLRGISDHSSPGGFWYRRDVAAEYLGTEAPAEVSAQVDTWEKVIALGQQVVEQSGGEVHLIPTYGDVLTVEKYGMQPFVADGALQIDPNWMAVLDTVRAVRDGGVDAKVDGFSPAWGAAWNDGSVVMFAMPAWAGFLIDREATEGKWAIATAPRPYYSGGTFRAIYTRSERKELAYEFIKYIAGAEWQNHNLAATLNMPALQSVYAENETTFRDPLLGDQPVLETYFPIATGVPPQPADEYSEDIFNLFGESITAMLTNGDANEAAIEDLKEKVRSAYPDIAVE